MQCDFAAAACHKWPPLFFMLRGWMPVLIRDDYARLIACIAAAGSFPHPPQNTMNSATSIRRLLKSCTKAPGGRKNAPSRSLQKARGQSEGAKPLDGPVSRYHLTQDGWRRSSSSAQIGNPGSDVPGIAAIFVKFRTCQAALPVGAAGVLPPRGWGAGVWIAGRDTDDHGGRVAGHPPGPSGGRRVGVFAQRGPRVRGSLGGSPSGI